MCPIDDTSKRSSVKKWIVGREVRIPIRIVENLAFDFPAWFSQNSYFFTDLPSWYEL